MKHIMIFDGHEEREEHLEAIMAGATLDFIEDFERELRRVDKWEELTDSQQALFDRLWQLWFSGREALGVAGGLA